MILDPAPTADLAEAMRALMRQAPTPAVRYLLLHGGWAEAYMRSRGARDANLNLWRTYREADMSEHLEGEKLEQWRRQQAVKNVT